jgi:hypothetical protein
LIRLEPIIEALVLPMLRLRARGKDPTLGCLLVRQATGPNSEASGIIRDLVNPVVEKVLETLDSPQSGQSPQEIVGGNGVHNGRFGGVPRA